MIDNAKLVEILASRRACEPALKWLKKRNSDEMWEQCNRPDWLLWWAAPYVAHTELVLVACQCARLALPHVAAGELRPLRAIETAEAWTRGETTLEDVIIAASAAADAASAAADAANAAAFAAYAVDAAYAVHSAFVVDAAADASIKSQMCELIREQWPTCPEPGVQG